MKKLIGVILTVVLILGSMSSAAFAETTPDTTTPTSAPITNKLTDKEITQLRDNMTKDGVDQETQNLLINKIQKGETLDCDNPEKIAAVPKDALTIRKGEMKKKYVFPDGSYIKSYMIPITPKNRDILLEAIGDQKKVDSLLARKKSRFTIQSGQTYDIWVQNGTIGTQGGFSCNFYLSSSNDSIINYLYGPSVWVDSGWSDTSTWQLSIPQKYENTTGAAHALFRYIWSDVGNWQSTCYVHFYISGGQYWSEFQLTQP